jgi:hypothetical protein
VGGISREKVFVAADEILATGVNPSQARVINRIGGSNSTVGPWLREWRQSKAGAAASVRSQLPDRPNRLDTAVQGMASQLWRSMEAEFAERLGIALTEANERLRAGKEDFDDAISNLKRLELELSSARSEQKRLEQARESAILEAARIGAVLDQIRKDLQAERDGRRVAEAAADEARRQSKELREVIQAKLPKSSSPKRSAQP